MPRNTGSLVRISVFKGGPRPFATLLGCNPTRISGGSRVTGKSSIVR